MNLSQSTIDKIFSKAKNGVYYREKPSINSYIKQITIKTRSDKNITYICGQCNKEMDKITIYGRIKKYGIYCPYCKTYA